MSREDDILRERARKADAKMRERNKKWRADLQKTAQEASKTAKPPQPPRRPPPPAKRAKAAKIRPIASRRAKHQGRYSRLRKEYLEQNPVCHCCIERKRSPTNPSVQIHHTAGREGELLNEVLFWMAICQECHDKIHRLPAWAHRKGYLLTRGSKNLRAEMEEKRGAWPHVKRELEREQNERTSEK